VTQAPLSTSNNKYRYIEQSKALMTHANVPKAQTSKMNTWMNFLVPPSNYGMCIRKRFNVIIMLWKHFDTSQNGQLNDCEVCLSFFKKMLKQCSSSMSLKTYHMASLIYSNMAWVTSLKPNTNNHICFRWLHFLSSFFKITKALWNMVVLKREPEDSSFNVLSGTTTNNSKAFFGAQ